MTSVVSSLGMVVLLGMLAGCASSSQDRRQAAPEISAAAAGLGRSKQRLPCPPADEQRRGGEEGDREIILPIHCTATILDEFRLDRLQERRRKPARSYTQT